MSVIGPRPQLVRDMVFMNDRQRTRHMRLLGIVLVIYTIIPSVPKMSITFNYVSWFCIIYLM